MTIDTAGRLVPGEPGKKGLFLDPEFASDMFYALNLYDTSKARCYHGWFGKSEAGNSAYSVWGGTVWLTLKAGGFLLQALNFAFQDLDLGPDAANNVRLKGQGTIEVIRLNNQK